MPPPEVARRGRPRSGEVRLSALAEMAQCDAFRLLLQEGARRNLTVEALTRQLSCDRKTIHGYLRTQHPRDTTVEKFCRVMGYRPIIARALVGRLNDADARNTELAIVHDIGPITLPVLVTDEGKVREIIRTGLRSLTEERRRAVLARYLLARAGLRKAFDAKLPIELAELDAALRPHGYGFARFARPMTKERQRNGLALMNAAYIELALGHNERTQITKLARHRVSELLKTMNLTRDPLTNEEQAAGFEEHFQISEMIDRLLRTLNAGGDRA